MAERFGKVLKGGTQQNWGTGDIQFCKFTSGTAGYLESISVFLFGGDPQNIKCAIYDSSKNFIAETEERNFPVSLPQGWRLFRFSSPPLVAVTTVYWLACWLSADICGFFYDAGAVGQANMKFYAYDGWPDPFADSVVQDRDFSMYATYQDTSVFGYTFKGSSEAVSSPDFQRAFKFKSKGAGTLESISLYLKYNVADAKVKCAIYDASWNLLTNGTTEEKDVLAGQDGWMIFNFATPPTIAENTYYNLAYWSDVAVKAYYEQFSEEDQYSWDGKAYNGWNDPFTADGAADYMYSIYANYVEVEPPPNGNGNGLLECAPGGPLPKRCPFRCAVALPRRVPVWIY